MGPKLLYPGDLISHKNIIRLIQSVLINFPSILFGYVCIGKSKDFFKKNHGRSQFFAEEDKVPSAREFSPLSLPEVGMSRNSMNTAAGWLSSG